jgi:hypothetical protein
LTDADENADEKFGVNINVMEEGGRKRRPLFGTAVRDNDELLVSWGVDGRNYAFEDSRSVDEFKRHSLCLGAGRTILFMLSMFIMRRKTTVLASPWGRGTHGSFSVFNLSL